MRLLKIEDIFQLELNKFMFKHKQQILPKPLPTYFCNTCQIHSVNTRAASQHSLYLPRCNKSVGKRFIRYLAFFCWNNLPKKYKEYEWFELNRFIRDLKRKILSEY